jgi:hypothetical protein
MAESGPSISANFHDLNVRFGEKQTFSIRLQIFAILILNNRN